MSEDERRRIKKSLQKMSPEAAKQYKQLDEQAAPLLGAALASSNIKPWPMRETKPNHDNKKGG